MRRPTDKRDAADKADFPSRKSGRASFEDGRSIWEWQTATGVFERNVTAEQFSKLEDANLSIVEDPEPTGTAIYAAKAGARPDVTTRTGKRTPAQSSTVLSRLLKRFS